MIESIFNSLSGTANAASIPVMDSVLTILISFILGVAISITYMKTANNKVYSQNFALTLVIIPAVIAIIVLLIGSNIARAFSLAGAFSIIRFRSAPGDPKDISFVYLPWQQVLLVVLEHIVTASCLQYLYVP